MFSRFDTILACDSQAHDDSIYRVSIASRCKSQLCTGNVEFCTLAAIISAYNGSHVALSQYLLSFFFII